MQLKNLALFTLVGLTVALPNRHRGGGGGPPPSGGNQNCGNNNAVQCCNGSGKECSVGMGSCQNNQVTTCGNILLPIGGSRLDKRWNNDNEDPPQNNGGSVSCGNGNTVSCCNGSGKECETGKDSCQNNQMTFCPVVNVDVLGENDRMFMIKV